MIKILFLSRSCLVKIVFSKIISTVTSVQGDDNDDDDDDEKGNNKERKENRKPKMKKHQGSAGVKSSIPFHSFHSFHSLWICVAMLLHMMKSCEAFDKLPNGNSCCSHSSCTPCTDSSLGGVVDEWYKGGTARATVVAKYGEIEIWDTSDVLSLHNVFFDKRTFNEDISKWDVSSVTNMYRSTSLSFFLSSFCSCIHKHILN
jgi:surface protein